LHELSNAQETTLLEPLVPDGRILIHKINANEFSNAKSREDHRGRASPTSKVENSPGTAIWEWLEEEFETIANVGGMLRAKEFIDQIQPLAALREAINEVA
jgi:hypothetical protein